MYARLIVAVRVEGELIRAGCVLPFGPTPLPHTRCRPVPVRKARKLVLSCPVGPSLVYPVDLEVATLLEVCRRGRVLSGRTGFALACDERLESEQRLSHTKSRSIVAPMQIAFSSGVASLGNVTRKRFVCASISISPLNTFTMRPTLAVLLTRRMSKPILKQQHTLAAWNAEPEMRKTTSPRAFLTRWLSTRHAQGSVMLPRGVGPTPSELSSTAISIDGRQQQQLT